MDPNLIEGGRSELLDLLSYVKKKVQSDAGMIDFPIPQFILLGKQSVGKSRLIESLAGEVFNFVSGTLGSRRPTVLEFRNSTIARSQWYILDRKTGQWRIKSIAEVLVELEQAHESLGHSISEVPIHVKVESPHCVDMQITDLPGFREFALDEAKQRLADEIEKLNTKFMKHPYNIMVCVEEAGDAANLATLTKCKKEDPNFTRTILVRNKLDKYYRDLTKENISEWVNGYGDLPPNLHRYSMTLPHWKEGENGPMDGSAFVELRNQMNLTDINEMKLRDCNETVLATIGYEKFAKSMSIRIEELFADAIVPVLKKMTRVQSEAEQMLKENELQIEACNPKIMLMSVRQAGMNFSRALQHVMEGVVHAKTNKKSLECELREFFAKYEGSDFLSLPSKDFDSLGDYCNTLRNDLKCPAMDIEINGGSQFSRLLFEVEAFCRFKELNYVVTTENILQARGHNVHGTTWYEVAVKILMSHGFDKMRNMIKYVGKRIKHFFYQQKQVMIEFMSRHTDSSLDHYSALFPSSMKFIESNESGKMMIYSVYDRTVDEQHEDFVNLFSTTLTTTMMDPFNFLKKHTSPKEQKTKTSIDAKAEAEAAALALKNARRRRGTAVGRMPIDEDSEFHESFASAQKRVAEEATGNSDLQVIFQQWISKIPEQAGTSTDPAVLAKASSQLQEIINGLFDYTRCKLADQIGLFTEAFFKLPLLRRLEEAMCKMELEDKDKKLNDKKRVDLRSEITRLQTQIDALQDCTERMAKFQNDQNTKKSGAEHPSKTMPPPTHLYSRKRAAEN